MSTLTLQHASSRRRSSAASPAAQAPKTSCVARDRRPRLPDSSAIRVDGKLPITTTLLTLTGRRVPCTCWPKSPRPHFDS
jgi:hypothetical protein